MSITNTRASAGSTVDHATNNTTSRVVDGAIDRIDRVLAEPAPAPSRVVACARQADELAVVVDHLIAEEQAAGGRARTVTALGLLGQALGELATDLRQSREVRS